MARKLLDPDISLTHLIELMTLIVDLLILPSEFSWLIDIERTIDN
jgi:hypothetical protein